MDTRFRIIHFEAIIEGEIFLVAQQSRLPRPETGILRACSLIDSLKLFWVSDINWFRKEKRRQSLRARLT